MHAFSVLVLRIEAELGATRGAVGFTYSLALVALTVAVLFGHRVHDRLEPALTACGALCVAALGLVIAGTATHIATLWMGYGLVFGAANGVGYSYALVLAARSWPARSGMAMGLATAAYALGAALFAQVFAALLEWHDLGATLYHVAAIVAGFTVPVGLALRGQRGPNVRTDSASTPLPRGLGLMWCAYACAVLAGLMAIGHAAPIVVAAGGSAALAAAGATLVAVGNATGGVLAGWLADRVRHRGLLAALCALNAFALLALLLPPSAALAAAALAVIGFAYGAVIAVYPATVLELAGEHGYGRAYGRVFTAWGVAGLAGPWLAGVAVEATGSYAAPLAAAAGFASFAVVLSARLPRPDRE